jgi:hypothetical protein
MDIAQALPETELSLARAASAKLDKVLQGMMSVGVASLQLESRTDFFTGENHAPLAFIHVLECVGVKPGFGNALQSLRLAAKQLSRLAARFHQDFLDLCSLRAQQAQDLAGAAERLIGSYEGCATRFVRFALCWEWNAIVHGKCKEPAKH